MRTIMLVLAAAVVTLGFGACASTGGQATLNGSASAPAVVY